MRKLNILLDSDGVCVQTMEKVIKLYNEEHGLRFRLEDIKKGDLSKIQQKGTDMFKYFKEKGFFLDLEPIFESQKYIKKMVEDGHNVFICTASPKLGIVDKIDNLLSLFPCLKEENIIPISAKHLLKGDIILDDGYHNIKSSICDIKVLYTQPWNESKEGDFLRVSNWKEFYNIVQEMK